MITPMPYQDPKDLVRGLIRTVPDWPKPGVMFRDITPMMQDPRAFRALIDMFVYRHMRNRLDAVVGIDACAAGRRSCCNRGYHAGGD